MAIREIVLIPSPVLRETALPVEDFNTELAVLLDDMVETMYHYKGIGLAGNQIGVLKRILVVDVSEDRSSPQIFINPKITEQEEPTTSLEGCLSIPEYRESITRSNKIKVQAFDKNGSEFELEALGLLAICLQHEIDHLNGVLFTDHLSIFKKQLFSRWCRKNLPLNKS